MYETQTDLPLGLTQGLCQQSEASLIPFIFIHGDASRREIIRITLKIVFETQGVPRVCQIDFPGLLPFNLKFKTIILIHSTKMGYHGISYFGTQYHRFHDDNQRLKKVHAPRVLIFHSCAKFQVLTRIFAFFVCKF